MALKDMFALIDDKLADVFHTRKPDPATLRAPVLNAIERTRTQFAQTADGVALLRDGDVAEDAFGNRIVVHATGPLRSD